MEKELKTLAKNIIATKAIKLLAEATEALSIIEDGDVYEHAFCHVIMALAVLSPEAPMPVGLAATLKKYGLVPANKVLEGEALDKAYTECSCSVCTARRQEKSANAPAPSTIQ